MRDGSVKVGSRVDGKMKNGSISDGSLRNGTMREREYEVRDMKDSSLRN